MIEFLSRLDKEIKQGMDAIYEYIASDVCLPKNVKVNVSIVSPTKIKQLNKRTRNIDKVTDVLTYPYIDLQPNKKLNLSKYALDIDPADNTLTIGDIYICKDQATNQAKEYGHSLKREMCFLFCHGMLHILGYDHIKDKDRILMEEKQREIMSAVNITRNVQVKPEFKCGFVTILGKTNAGKSTLINTLVGEHVAIVSPKTQTTRENIIGIYNDDDSQIIFVDTPGYHKRANKIDDEMDKHINIAKQDTEILLMLITANKDLVSQYEELSKLVNSNAKKILLINKIDETTFEKLYPQLSKLSSVAKTEEILPISALKGKNCDVLINLIKKYLPTYDFPMRYYPIDEYTDKNLRHMVAEIVREKALLLLDDEIPHGVHVVVTSYEESSNPINICADLYCEKENHKSIILGKNGSKIKDISTRSRISIEKLIGSKVNLQLYVKVKPNWRNDTSAIDEFGLLVRE